MFRDHILAIKTLFQFTDGVLKVYSNIGHYVSQEPCNYVMTGVKLKNEVKGYNIPAEWLLE